MYILPPKPHRADARWKRRSLYNVPQDMVHVRLVPAGLTTRGTAS